MTALGTLEATLVRASNQALPMLVLFISVGASHPGSSACGSHTKVQVIGKNVFEQGAGVSQQLGAPDVDKHLERSGRTVFARTDDRATGAVPAASGLLTADPLEGGLTSFCLGNSEGVQL